MEYWGPRDDSVVGTYTALLEVLDSIPSTPIRHPATSSSSGEIFDCFGSCTHAHTYTHAVGSPMASGYLNTGAWPLRLYKPM